MKPKVKFTILFSLPTFYLLLLISMSTMINAQSPGDILFTGYNSDGADEFSFMASTSIPGNIQFHFTDNGWTTANGGEFRVTEGEIVYTTPSEGLLQGDQIVIRPLGTSPSIIHGSGTVSKIGSNNIVLSAAGDGIICFMGSMRNPSPIAAISTDASGWVNPSANTQTNIPNGLVEGESAFLLLENGSTESDNWIYNCDSIYGTKSSIQMAIAQLNNWTSNNSSSYTLPCSPFKSIWNGSWAPSAPSAQNSIEIISSSPINTDITCRNLVIGFGISLNLDSNDLHIYGDIENFGNGIQTTGELFFHPGVSELSISANPITLENIVHIDESCVLNADSNLILAASSQTSFGQLTGDGEINNVIFQRYLDASNPQYFYLGMPLKNALLEEFNEGELLQSSNSSDGSIWQWDAGQALWVEPGNVNQTTAISGKAYAVYAGSNSFGTFLLNGIGQLNFIGSATTDSVSINLEYNDGQGSSSPNFTGGTSIPQTQGWNLLSNPYNCYYDWDLQSIPSNLSGAIYRFDGSNYISYIQGLGNSSRFIAPGEAFFVQLNSNIPGTLHFNPEFRNPNRSISSNKNSKGFDGLEISLKSIASKNGDKLYIGFDSSASQLFDPKLDAWKFKNPGEIPNLYIEMPYGNLSIHQLALDHNKLIIPISIDCSIDAANLEMKVSSDMLKSNIKFQLEDLKTGQMYSARKNSGLNLVFANDSSFRKDRFRLHLNRSDLSKIESKKPEFYISQNEDGILIHQLEKLSYSKAELLDLNGRIIKSQKLENIKTPIPINKNGLFILKLKNEKDQFCVEKILFQG